MDKFKIRCSQIGQIMTNPRSKKDFLSKTTQNYCETWLKEQLYNREYEFYNKYTQKGIIVEDNAIDRLADHLDVGLLFKNEQHFDNGYMTGTPDVLTDKLLADVKSSWDVFTFPLFFDSIPNKDYYWQAQGYMNLTDRDEYILAYVLCDTPDFLIESEMKRYNWNNGAETTFEEWHAKMTYSDISDELRIKTFKILRNDDDIEKIKQRVMECREYINDLNNKL